MMPDSTRKDDANYGGKIFLPPSALNKLTMLHIRYPMLFELCNEDQGLKTHSGVLEFVAEEGRVYIPQWMMSTLKLQPGSIIKITNSDVPLGKFVKIEPQSVDFLDISDPKAVLENVLRKFSTLTVNDIIEVSYNNKIFAIKVLEVKPESDFNSICVIETDLETDFAPPVGYVEPEYKKPANEPKKELDSSVTIGSMAKSINYKELAAAANQATSKFGGDGQKLSGKAITKKSEQNLNEITIDLNAPPAPLILPTNQYFFGFPYVPPKKDESEDSVAKGSSNTAAFSGQGQSLRQSKKRSGAKNLNSPKPSKAHSPEVIEID